MNRTICASSPARARAWAIRRGTLSLVGCRICGHAEQESIEGDASRSSVAVTAGAYGLSELALERHLRSHVRLVEESAPTTQRSPVAGRPILPVRTLPERERGLLHDAIRTLDAMRDALLEAVGCPAVAMVEAPRRTVTGGSKAQGSSDFVGTASRARKPVPVPARAR